jgi:hypothetical protein
MFAMHLAHGMFPEQFPDDEWDVCRHNIGDIDAHAFRSSPEES